MHKLDGMVLYNKPVFHNGHLFLWHGAWRGNPTYRYRENPWIAWDWDR
jgi:hypothetical protein